MTFRTDELYRVSPMILLNLVLSCLAALQAPVIMMSQNRQAARDRSDAKSDYEVNLRAEMEITAVHTKLDLLREQQWVASSARSRTSSERSRPCSRNSMR